jgi:hypothetical protein
VNGEVQGGYGNIVTDETRNRQRLEKRMWNIQRVGSTDALEIRLSIGETGKLCDTETPDGMKG